MSAPTWIALSGALFLTPPRGQSALLRLGGLPGPPLVHPSGRRWRPPVLLISLFAVAGVAVAVSVLAMTSGWLVALAGLAVACSVASGVRDLQRGRAAANDRAELLRVVGAVHDEVQAGRDLDEARARVIGSGDGVATLADPVLPVVERAWAVSRESGVRPLAVLTGVLRGLEAERRHAAAVGVALSGPRATALLLAGLPVVGVVLGLAMGANPVGIVLHTRPGRTSAAIGVILDALGVLWVGRILNRAAAS